MDIDFESFLPFLKALKRGSNTADDDTDPDNPTEDGATPAQANSAPSGATGGDASNSLAEPIAAQNAALQRAGMPQPGNPQAQNAGSPRRGPGAQNRAQGPNPNAGQGQNPNPAQNPGAAQVAAQNARPPIPLGQAPPPPKPPALVEYNGHEVSDPRVKAGLEAISKYFASSTVNVRSGDRDYRPQGSPAHSPHLSHHAADIHVMGKTDDQVKQMLKDPMMADALRGLRVLQHGPYTATEGPHIHIDSVDETGQPADANEPVEFMHEGMDAAGRNVYTIDPNSPRRAAHLAAQRRDEAE